MLALPGCAQKEPCRELGVLPLPPPFPSQVVLALFLVNRSVALVHIYAVSVRCTGKEEG